MPKPNRWFIGERTCVPGLLAVSRAERPAAMPPMTAHAHGPRRLEIIYLARGRRTYYLDGAPYPLRGGDVLVVRPGQLHDSGRMKQERCTFYAVVVQLSNVRGRFLCLRGRAADSLRKGLGSVRASCFAGDPVMARHLDDYFDARASMLRDPLASAAAATALHAFLIATIRCAVTHQARPPNPWIEGILSHIDKHIGEPLVVRELAARTGLTADQFHRHFRNQTGLAPHDYVLRRRVDVAQQRLASSRIGITQLAFELGFSSSQHFATVFRRYTGIAPRECRRP
jgi:AraC-like DNA-binding protein